MTRADDAASDAGDRSREPLLSTRGLTAHYGDFQALFGIDLDLFAGETVAIIGANGAGKTTFLRSVAGVLPNAPETIRFDGRPIGAMRAAEIVRLGIATVPEGRRLFPSLSVEENLLVGAHGRKIAGHWNLQRIYALFPNIAERRHAAGNALSGGQQQMVAIGRALMSNPRVLLCDEISLGLAPIVIRDIYKALPEIKAEGASLVIVEQDIVQAMRVADRVYCFQEGRMTLTGKPDALTREQIHNAYFGL
jgi:branched-chain amino acid transport system ATP-binding protein